MNEFQLDVGVRLEMLEKEAAGLRVALTALAVKQSEESPAAAEAVRAILSAAAINAEIVEGRAAGLPVRTIIHTLEILLHGGLPPARVLLVQALQVADAGPGRRRALETWQTQATDDELTEDMLRLLRKYGIEVAGDDDAAKPC